ncbi:histidinol dehydrogenase [Usitatibacter palustris]|uniref:Histidinol dehydrogenase n=1 Tax=Usitatibacter palustris TaxID=2732487 RepID=A0A6M4HCA2_9PROT|nr:histidinol dehydrogenase [Usitatibacter palustris]QJR16378.1 Histidinol dehydrogenase [Usitatibacter palustris]
MAEPKILATDTPDFEAAFERLLAFESAQDEAVDRAAATILEDVRARGDAALLDATRRFDGWNPASAADLVVDLDQARAALGRIGTAERDALEQAAARIRSYHERQRQPSWQFEEEDGTVLGQRVTPLDRVGLYVPGGKAAYPSSVLMNAVTAKVAGVHELAMVTPTPRGELNDYVLAAAAIAGVDSIYRVGGAQAVGAFAYGTATIAAVDKVVGPGNAYVAAAKRRVFGRVGIDMVAGPSEILVIADASADPRSVAMDLLSQAEHDELAQAILLTADDALLKKVANELRERARELPRAAIVAESVSGRGALIRVRDLDEACELANRIAPEHLELAVADPEALLPKIRHAGAIFLGHHTSEALGDYCAGPNHVLPTSRTARFSSPLGVYDFQKRSSLIGVSAKGATRLGRIAVTLARAEGLEAHARSAELRIAKDKP